MKNPTNPLALRILQGLAKSVLGLALLVATLWVGAYFALGSGPGQRALATLVRDESGLAPDLVRWGPALDELVVGGLDVSAPAEPGGVNTPMMSLTLASLDLGLWSLLGKTPTIELLRVELAFVHANIGPDGRVDILMVLSPPRRPGSEPAAPRAKAPPRFAIERLELVIGELYVVRGAEGLHLRDLAVGGRVVLGEGLEAALEFKTGELHLAFDRGRRVWVGAGLDLALSASGDIAEPSELQFDLAATLRHSDSGTSRLALGLGLGRPLTVGLDADLSAADVAALLPGADLPDGIQLTALHLEGSPAATSASPNEKEAMTLSGHLGHAFAPVLGLGSAELHDASFGLAAIAIDTERIIPQVEVVFSHLQATRLVLRPPLDPDSGGEEEPAAALPIGGWTLEDLDFAGGQLSFIRRLELHLWPGRALLGRPGFPAEQIDLAIDADLGLTGGPITARLASELGTVLARGKLRVSPLTGKTGFGAEVAFAELDSALARALWPELPADHRLAAADAPRVSGAMTIELESAAGEPSVAFDEGVLTWPGGRLLWDGYGWSDDKPALAPDAPDAPSPTPAPAPTGPAPTGPTEHKSTP